MPEEGSSNRFANTEELSTGFCCEQTLVGAELAKQKLKVFVRRSIHKRISLSLSLVPPLSQTVPFTKIVALWEERNV